MAAFDPTTATPVAQGAFDPNSAAMVSGVPEARGNLAEIGTGFARGALADLPTMAGQALQFAGANNVGAAVRGFGERMGASPSLAMQPDQHGGATNFLASGAEQVPAIAGAVGGGMLAAAALPAAVPGLVAAGIGAAPLALAGAGQIGQQTLEAAQAKGLSPEAAQSASRLNAATTFATQVGMGLVGGKVLGAVGNALGKAVGSEAAPLANQVLDQLTGNGGWLKAGLKAGAMGAVENTALGAVQAGATAGVNNAYGISDQNPLAAAAESIPQMLSLSAVLTPLGLASRALQVRAAAAKTETLASEKTDPAVRQQMADQYAAALPTSVAQQNFVANAKIAIDHGLPLKVDTGLFDQGAVQAPVPEAPPEAPFQPAGLLPAPQAPAAPAHVVFPNGEIATSQDQVDTYVNGLPENMRSEAMARLLGQGPQAADAAAPGLLANNPTPPTPDQMVANSNGLIKREGDSYTFPDGSSTKDVSVVQQYLDAQNAPKTAEQLATEYDAAKQQRDTAIQSMLQAASRPAPGVSAQDMINQITGADNDSLSKSQKAKRQADAKAAINEPSGVRVSDAETGIERELSMGELYDLRNQPAPETAPENGIVTPPAEASGHATIAPEATPVPAVPSNSAKAPDAIKADVDAVNEANNFSTKQQSMVPFQKKLDSLGLDKLGSHQEQIDALSKALDDQQPGQLRDRMDALLNKWKGENVQDAAQEPVHAPDTLGNVLQNTADSLQKQADTAAANRQAASDALFKAQQEAAGAQLQATAASPFGGARAAKANTRLAAAQTALADAQRVHQSQVDSHNTLSESLVAAQQQLSDHQNRDEIAARAAQKAADIAEQQKNLAAALPEAPAQADALPENIPASVESQAPAATNAALPENIPASVQAQSPGTDAALPENLTQSPRSHAQDSADMVDAALAGFNQRLRGGEKLSDLEQERYEDLQGFRNTLGEITAGGNHSDDYTQNISEMARDAATAPYKTSYRRVAPENPEATNPSIMRDALRTGKLKDTLDTIAANGSTPETQALAKRLSALDTGTTIKYAPADGTDSIGEFKPDANHVNIFPGGESEQTILHEAAHAAQQAQITRAQQITSPKTQREAELKKALNTVESIRQTAIERAGANSQYGLADPHEFLAELNTNPEFQKFLKSQQLNQQSLWTRAVNAVKSLLGMKTDDFLSKAMEANETFFQKPGEAGFPLPAGSQPDVLFRKSPADAAKVTDDQLSKMGKLGDAIGDKINVDRISAAAYRSLASWKTVEYLADRIRALPEMVQSGFSRGVDAFVHANMVKEVAHRFVADPFNAYAARLTKARTSYGDNARDVEGKMATVSGEASRGGFDYRMNYADNLKAGRDLPAANKAYIDDIHRQFTQLQRSNPDAAKHIVEGQLLNHKGLVNLTSVIARNLLDVAAGSHSRYTDDLAKLAPTDPARAAALARVEASQLGHEMSSQHSAKLDIMDKALASARNTKPDTFSDGATQVLDARLNAMFTDARKLPEGSALRGHLNELEQMYRAQSQNPYFALGRSGDYFVKASLKGVDEATQKKIQDALKGSNKVIGNLVGHDGDIFFRTDTMDQASGLHNKLIQAAGLKMAPASAAYGKLAMSDPQFVHGTSQALRSMLSDLHSTVENSGLSGAAADAMRETMTRSLLSLLPETSSRSAKMNRQGIPGYDADFSGNYARRAMGMAQDTANLYSQHAFDSAFSQMKAGNQQLNRTGSEMAKERSTDTMNEITQRYANMHSAVDNKVINTMNSLGHTFYLAMSPAYLIRTTAQLFHRGLPYLGSKYGFVNSAKEIGAATKDALAITGNSLRNGWKAEGIRGTLNAKLDFESSKLTDSEKAFLQEAHDRGYLDLGQTRQLQNMALGGTQRQQDLQRFASITAQAAETTNRLATGLAAFRLAEKGSKDVTQAGRDANVEYGIKAINNVMDNFDPTNTARAIGKYGFAGKATPLLTAFMNYNLQTMQQIARTVHDGMFNKDQSPEGMQRATEARKEFSGLMATTMMISGAMGLPFANVFAGLYNTYKDLTDPDSPGDIRISAQQFLANTFGKTAGEVLSHGLPRLANFDSSTFGLENLMPGSEFLASRQLLKDRLADQSQALMGPALNGAVGIGEAMHQMYQGYWAKGIEAALPSGLKPYFKAYELATKGYTDSKDNPIPLKATGWDVALQAAGFHTGTRATQLEAQQFKDARTDQLADRSSRIQDQFYKAATHQDPAAMATAQQNMMAFNQANPTQPIRNVAGGVRSQMAMLAMGNAFGAGFNVTRQQMPALAGQIGFARDNAMPGE